MKSNLLRVVNFVICFNVAKSEHTRSKFLGSIGPRFFSLKAYTIQSYWNEIINGREERRFQAEHTLGRRKEAIGRDCNELITKGREKTLPPSSFCRADIESIRFRDTFDVFYWCVVTDIARAGKKSLPRLVARQMNNRLKATANPIIE